MASRFFSAFVVCYRFHSDGVEVLTLECLSPERVLDMAYAYYVEQLFDAVDVALVYDDGPVFTWQTRLANPALDGFLQDNRRPLPDAPYTLN